MTRTFLTAAAAALLASTTFFASFDDAEARGAGRASGVHRMGNPARHAGMARSANVHRGQSGRAGHVGRVHAMPQVNKGLHAGQVTRHGGNLGQLNQGSNLNRPNRQAGSSSLKSAKLSPGPGSLQKQSQGRTYREMGMDNANTPQQANNTPGGPDNKGKQNHQHNQGQAIITNWKNTFIQNLNPKNIYDVGQSGKFPIGTTFSLCLNAAACAAGAPPAVVEVLTAPLPAVTTSALEAGVNAFTPIDPNDPLSTPVDMGAKKAALNMPNAVKQQLGGSFPPAWGDLK